MFLVVSLIIAKLKYMVDSSLSFVYRHVRPDINKPFYIGIGVNSNGRYDRAFSKDRTSKIWKDIVHKNNGIFEVDILLWNLGWEEACDKEREFIKIYGRIDNKTGILANLTDGGEGSLGIIPSIETLKKRSIALSGVNNPMFGKKFSPEYREKLSKAKIGSRLSEEHKAKILQSTRKRIINIDTLEVYNSIEDLSKILKIHGSTLGRRLNGKIRNDTSFRFQEKEVKI